MQEPLKPAGTGGQYQPARPEDVPRATHESVQELFGVRVRTYVLDDGRRVIHADDMHQLLAVMVGTANEP